MESTAPLEIYFDNNATTRPLPEIREAILEVLGAAGFKDLKKTVGEEGRLIDFYDLEERTFLFAKRVRIWIKQLSKSVANVEDSKQLIRASGSVGANYIEANESLSKRDFLMRIKRVIKDPMFLKKT